ncbi:MAG: hypothetical protein HOV94_10740 [Saccharothrix sp.]|nr:hypothetical protein [Saccharothrix sp.]
MSKPSENGFQQEDAEAQQAEVDQEQPTTDVQESGEHLHEHHHHTHEDGELSPLCSGGGCVTKTSA